MVVIIAIQFRLTHFQKLRLFSCFKECMKEVHIFLGILFYFEFVLLKSYVLDHSVSVDMHICM